MFLSTELPLRNVSVKAKQVDIEYGKSGYVLQAHMFISSLQSPL
jgi:hypothetical protein